MPVRTIEGQGIIVGYPWRNRLKTVDRDGGAGAVLFPAGAEVRVQVKASRASDALIVLTIGNGLTRISDTELDIEIGAAQTALLKPGTTAFMSFVRTDLIPHEAIRIGLRIPVVAL